VGFGVVRLLGEQLAQRLERGLDVPARHLPADGLERIGVAARDDRETHAPRRGERQPAQPSHPSRPGRLAHDHTA
jgi:hypothetical protein